MNHDQIIDTIASFVIFSTGVFAGLGLYSLITFLV